MFSTDLNGKRRRKTGITAILSLKTEDLLFGQHCCGYSQETALAQNRIYQHLQCQLHPTAFSLLAAHGLCLGKGQSKAEAESSSHFSSSPQCPLLYPNNYTFIFNYHFSFVTNGNSSTAISTVVLLKPMLLSLFIENSMVTARKH